MSTLHPRRVFAVVALTAAFALGLLAAPAPAPRRSS